MSRRKKIAYISFAAAAAVLLVFGIVTAFFTEVEHKDNIVTIGRVSMEITENFDNGQTLVSGQKAAKAPKITNTGKNDEYVFVQVRVPLESVQMVDSNGNIVDPTKQLQEIFNILSAPDVVGKDTAGNDIEGTVKALDKNDLYINAGDSLFTNFTFHNGGNSNVGWVFINYRKDTDKNQNIYTFGYNRRLVPGDTTRTLFDEIQLKSFIDEQLQGTDGTKKSEQIAVVGYGIQADDLGLTDDEGNDLSAKAALDYSDLKKIYAIIKNKAGD